FLPVVILGVPIVDTAWALRRRAKGRAGLTMADKNHLHHRLMRLGHGQRRAVLILWTWTALLSAAVLVPVYTGSGLGVVPLAVAGMGLLLYTLLAPGRWARREGGDAEPTAWAPTGSDRAIGGPGPRSHGSNQGGAPTPPGGPPLPPGGTPAPPGWPAPRR